MRTVKYALSYDEEQLLASMPKQSVNELIVPEDIFADLIGLCYYVSNSMAVFPQLITFDELYRGADELMRKKGMAKIDKSLLISSLFDYRRDMIVFTNSGLLDHFLNLNVPYLDRVKMLLEAMSEALKMYVQVQNSAGNNTSSTAEMVQSNSGMGAGSLPSAIQSSVDIIGSLMPETEGVGGNSYGHCGPGELAEREAADAALAKALPGLIRDLCNPRNYTIFQLAQGFNTALGEKAKTMEDANHGTDREIRKFRRTSDIKDVSAKDLALPSEVLSAKVGTKSLLISKPQNVKKDEDQLVYVLADVSGSMVNGSREAFMKATLIALAKNAVDKNIPFAFRFFAGNPGPIERVSKTNWIPFVKKVFSRQMGGDTSLHKALSVAAEDVKSTADLAQAELVLITDGTEPASRQELDERVKVKRHAILIEKAISESHALDTFKESFDTTIVANTSSVEEAMSAGLDMIKAL